jgi:hypothetical protein
MSEFGIMYGFLGVRARGVFDGSASLLLIDGLPLLLVAGVGVGVGALFPVADLLGPVLGSVLLPLGLRFAFVPFVCGLVALQRFGVGHRVIQQPDPSTL